MNCAHFFIAIKQYFGITGLVTLLGFFILPPLGYYFGMKAFRRQQAFTAYRSFKKVFFSTLQDLERLNASFIQILNTDFPKHEQAMREFVLELTGDALASFNKKWAEYKDTYEKWGNFNKSNPNAIFAENNKFLFETFKDNHPKKGSIACLEDFFNEDIANKKYMEYLIYDILKIAKKY